MRSFITENLNKLALLESYFPPENCAEFERRYTAGDLYFRDAYHSEVDLCDVRLDGVHFEKHSCFSNADFSGGNLHGTSFGKRNLNCVDFSNCPLTGAIFQLAAIRSVKTKGVAVAGIKNSRGTLYGCEFVDGDEPLLWEW